MPHPMDLLGIAGLALSVIAIVIAARSQRRANAISAEHNTIQRRLLLLESRREAERSAAARKAVLQATIARNGKSTRILVANRGECKATQVSVRVDGMPVLEHDLVPKGVPEIREIPAGGTISYLMAPHFGSPTTISVELQWEDASGEQGAWDAPLGVFG